MSTLTLKQSPSPTAEIDRAIADLSASKLKLSKLSLAERRALIEDCLARVLQLAPEWVEAACEAKQIQIGRAHV
jgi:acyl-CoA reductase-like NAD-dependent aldehyde dehydrogenase